MEYHIYSLSPAQKVVLKARTQLACSLVFWVGLLGWWLNAPVLSGHADESFFCPESLSRMALCMLPLTCLFGLCFLCCCLALWMEDHEVREYRGEGTIVSPASGGFRLLAVKGALFLVGVISAYWTILLKWFMGGEIRDNPWLYISVYAVVFLLQGWLLRRFLGRRP